MFEPLPAPALPTFDTAKYSEITDLMPRWSIRSEQATGREFMVKEVIAASDQEVQEYRGFVPYECCAIASFVGMAVSGRKVALFRELIVPPRCCSTPRGDLATLIELGLQLDDADSYIIAIGVAHAVSVIHARGEIHGNVRIENVLLNADKDPVVVGYGISATARAKEGLEARIGNGSSWFCAPEVLRSRVFTKEADVYALGTMLYFVRRKKMPSERPEVRKAILDGARLPIATGIPPAYRATIEKCWAPDPAKRPSAAAVVDEMLLPVYKTMVKHERLANYLKKLGRKFPSNWR
jgi:hypothetical protein